MSNSYSKPIKPLPTWTALQSDAYQAVNINDVHDAGLSRLDRIAVWVTDKIGTMGFFLVIFVWTVGWLGWNVVGPTGLRFDPYPGFVLWLLISNMIQIHLMPLIMIGQNLQNRHSELRAESDYKINQKAELEVEAILGHLTHQNDIMLEILRRIEALEKTKVDPTVNQGKE